MKNKTEWKTRVIYKFEYYITKEGPAEDLSPTKGRTFIIFDDDRDMIKEMYNEIKEMDFEQFSKNTQTIWIGNIKRIVEL